MKVFDVMTLAPVTVREDETLDGALRLLDEHGFRHLPVVRGSEVVGVVSDRDLLEATGWLPKCVHACRGPGGAREVPTLVADVMRGPVVTATPDERIIDVVVEFLHRSIGCLPVVEHGELIGVVTEVDLLEVYVQGSRHPMTPLEPEPAVGERMTKEPIALEPEATLATAKSICRSNSVRHFPVVDCGHVIGIVSDRDLRRAAGVGRRADTALDELMSRDVISIDPDAPLSDAARAMLEEKISALVVTVDEELVGILTLSDVLDFFLDAHLESHRRDSSTSSVV